MAEENFEGQQMAEEKIEEQDLSNLQDENVSENSQHSDEVKGDGNDAEDVNGDGNDAEEVNGDRNDAEVKANENDEAKEVIGDENDANEVKGNEDDADEVKGNEDDADEVKGNEIDAEEVNGSEIDAEEVNGSEKVAEEVKGDENDAVIVEEKKWPGWPGENVFRLLVPAQRVGGIIGRKGEYIKKICEETKARIKILDGPPGTTERTVMVSAKEEPDLQMPPALDGLLKIHKHILDLESDPANARSGGTSCTRLLVAASQAGSLIGKQGATIKSIQDDSHCTVRVLGEEHLPVFALPDDSVVEIQGEPEGLCKGVELIATHLRKFLVDRSVVGVFEAQMKNSNVRANQNMAPPHSWGPPPPSFPMNPEGHGYASNHPPPMQPHPRQYDNYYPPVDNMPPYENQSRGPTNFGRDMPMGARTTNMQSQQAVIGKVTQNMQIQLSYADAVIGINGANISYIRRASGATIAIQETRGIPGEMTVEINGSSSQVQAAQQLIQNSIADAVSSAQNAQQNQSYNPYASHGPVYTSPPSNAAGQTGYAPPPGDYNGAGYGY